VVGSGDSFVPFQAAAHLPPTVSHLLLQALLTENSSRKLPYLLFSGRETCQPATFAGSVYWKFVQRAAPCSSPFLRCAQSIPPSLLHVLFSSLFIIQFFVLFCFVLWSGGRSIQGAMLVYPRGGCGSTMCHLFAHLLVCVSQAGLELPSTSGSMGSLLFSQCNMAWRSFVWAGGSGCWSFANSWWFFPAKCGSSILARFLIYGAHTVCFLPLVAILDPNIHFLENKPILLSVFPSGRNIHFS
jgi:hypothetical protein